MNSSRTGRREAAADLTGEFGVRAGHEGRRLFMAHLHEAESFFLLRFSDRLHYAVDSVSRKAEDGVDAPVKQGFDKDFCGRGHVMALLTAVSQLVEVAF